MKLFCYALAIALAGCTTVSPPDQSFAYRPGSGVIESVRPAHVAIPANAIAGSPSAGGSYNTPMDQLVRPRWTDGYQLTLRMDDGSTQSVTQRSASFKPGERVEVTRDGLVVGVPSAPVAIASPVPAAPAPASAYRAGTGTVVSMVSEQSASAGASASAAPPYLMTLRMDDGSTQTIHENSLSFVPGERVRVTAEGRVVRP